MFTKYDEYELLELFASEPIEVCEKEAGVFLYNREDIYGFKLSLYMSIYANTCSISLTHKDLTNAIFDIGLDNVKCIKGQKNRLIIEQNDIQQNVIIYFKPNYALVYEKQEI